MKFFDLGKQFNEIKEDVKLNLDKVIEEAAFIQGKEVFLLEEKLSNFVGSECLTVGNGTDALVIALRSLDIKHGDEVIVPSFTWVSSAESIKLVGAKPVFCDVDVDTFNIDPSKINSHINNRTKAIMAVSLFGQCAELITLKGIAEDNNLFLIEDGAQSFGAEHHGKKSCSIADISTTSFFPTKPLACYGDGGAIFSNSDTLIGKSRILSKNGQKARYDYREVGFNSRLDTMQASILLNKLKIFETEIKKKNEIKDSYESILGAFEFLTLPKIQNYNLSVLALYTLKVDVQLRDSLHTCLLDNDIPCGLYYPIGIHKTGPYKSDVNLENTDFLNKSVLSIPMHAYLNDVDLEKILDTFSKFSKTC